MHRLRILVVDDEPQMHRFLGPALNAAGYEPLRAETGRQALAEIARRPPDAVVLDLGLPDVDGQEVLRMARAFYDGPIIILSARDREIEKIEALDAGADDYVEKPFRVGEMLARLRVIMRRQLRQAEAPPAVVHAEDLTIDIPRRLVTRAGEPVHLSPKEYDLLVKLAQADGKVLTHKDLLISLWGPAHVEDMQYLRVFIGQLRQKIEADPSAPRLILTQPGIGYRFMADEVTRAGG
ncbi:MAG TPA: response regulator [Phenylobacterium sp.]|jgi:two-component system KDP operon response regulator KdpE|uniref:response regulator n=1 Tax=Phenylobacterium sp. TaxID=1871053 RepID=UPI002D126D59|nr:response regulator [Phenylobacterium sp.]HXA40973.1 response regulator [Phenylobacterium sp.]